MDLKSNPPINKTCLQEASCPDVRDILGRIASSSIFFGALSIAVNAFIFAIFALFLVLAAMPSFTGEPLPLSLIAHAAPFIAPFMMFAYSALFSIPSALIASIIYFLGSLLICRFKLHRSTFFLLGALSGFIGAGVIFRNMQFSYIGAFSAGIGALIWLRFRELAQIEIISESLQQWMKF